MSKKRFTDPQKWRNEWFRELEHKAKLAWVYLCDECDFTGIWKADYGLASYQLNFKLSKPLLNKWFGDKIHFFDADSVLILGFYEFQYGDSKDTWTAKIKAKQRLETLGFSFQKNKIIKPNTDHGVPTVVDSPPTVLIEGVSVIEVVGVVEKLGESEGKFSFDEFFEILKPVIKVEGPQARERFAKQITSQKKWDELLTASRNYIQSLQIQAWRHPKTSVATFLGTERSGQFWRDFINLDLMSLKTASQPANFKNEVQEYWTTEAHNIFKNIKDYGIKSREVLGPERWNWINSVGGYDFVNRIKYDDFGVKKLADMLRNANQQEASA